MRADDRVYLLYNWAIYPFHADCTGAKLQVVRTVTVETPARKGLQTVENAHSATFTSQLLGWVEAFLLDVETQGRSPETVRTYRVILEQFTWWSDQASFKGVDSISPNGVRQFTRYMQTEAKRRFGDDTYRSEKTLAPTTVQGYLRMLKVFVNWLVDEGVFERSPIERLKPPKAPVRQPVPLTDDELRTLLDACHADKGIAGIRDAAIILTLLDTGLRAFELVQMPAAISPTGAVTLIGKGNKERTVQLGREARRVIIEVPAPQKRHPRALMARPRRSSHRDWSEGDVGQKEQAGRDTTCASSPSPAHVRCLVPAQRRRRALPDEADGPHEPDHDEALRAAQ